LHALPSDQARQQKKLMTQALLADRFQLKAHQETRELPVFNLVIAKGGPKFKASDKNGTSIDSGNTRIHVQGSDNTIDLLVRALAQALGRVVVDKTGIDARYDLTLRWTPDNVPAPMLNGAPDPNPAPNIFTAIQEQLGLKLEPAKGAVPVLVIDRVEMPSEN
ncbi:MAG: TIGR03435 family protein, partial [Acidobacteriota bacterium]|nr:TIGR03435 family protein [Acidobacteriota bacterium]